MPKIETSLKAIVDAPSTNIINQGKQFPWSTPTDLNSQNKNELLVRFAQNFSPLFNVIWNGALSNWFREQMTNNAEVFWDENVKYDRQNKRLVVTGFNSYAYQDRAPLDMSEACCNVPFEMQRCNREFELRRVCDMECREELEAFIEKKRKSLNFVGEDGRISRNQASKDFNLLLSFAFDRIRHALVGTSNTTSDGLGEFNGLKSFVDSPYTTKTVGGSIVTSLEAIKCRIDGMKFDPATSYIAFPERLKTAFSDAVAPDMRGNYYRGITYENGKYYFYGIEVVFDPYVDMLPATNMGTAILLDTRFVGFLWGLPNMALPMEFFKSASFEQEREENYSEEQTITNNKGNCFNECRAIFDFGTTVVTDYNYLMKVTNIVNTATCSAAVFEGSETGLVAPKTPTLI